MRIDEPFTLVSVRGVEVARCDALADSGLSLHGLSTRRNAASTPLDVAQRPVVAAEQVHGDHVAVLGRADIPADGHPIVMPGTDGLVTRERGVLLVMTFADCVPVFLFDPETPAVGLAHAGWRGTAAGIAAKTMRAMADSFGTRPEACIAAIGPAIGPCCYEVGPEVALEIAAASSEGKVVEQGADGRVRADLPACNVAQLRHLGVQDTRIHASRRCTACGVGVFYSHRGERGRAGRMAAFMALP